MVDLEAAMKSIALRPRAEGETAFPEVATIIAETEAARRKRRIAGERERRIADEAAELRRRRTHPEEFEAFGPADIEALAKKSAGKFSFDRPKQAEPVVKTCPHCSEVLPLPANMRFWTSDEVAAFAKLLASNERIAAANREANKAVNA